MNATSEMMEGTLLQWRDMVRHSSKTSDSDRVRILGDLVEGTAAVVLPELAKPGADGLGAIPVALIASFPRVAALTDDLTRVTAAMAAIPGLAVYRSVDGSPWVHRLTPIEWGGW